MILYMVGRTISYPISFLETGSYDSIALITGNEDAAGELAAAIPEFYDEDNEAGDWAELSAGKVWPVQVAMTLEEGMELLRQKRWL